MKRMFSKRIFSIVLCLSILFSMSAVLNAEDSTASVNLIKNPGFESGGEGWDIWSNTQVVKEDPHSGTSHIKAGKIDSGGLAQNITTGIVPKGNYHLAAFGKVGDSDGTYICMGVKCFAEFDIELLKREVAYTSATYDQKAIDFIVPQDTVKIMVYFWKGKGEAYLNLDDVELTTGSQAATPAPVEIVVNPDPAKFDKSNGQILFEAETYTDSNGVKCVDNLKSITSNAKFVGSTHNGDYVGYKDVDFGNGFSYIQISTATENIGGKLEFRVGTPAGKKIGELAVPNTYSWGIREGVSWSNGWTSSLVKIAQTKGKNNLYVIFKGKTDVKTEVCDIDWLRLLNKTAPKEYYVSIKGLDSNNGSLAKPFKTIKTAINKILPGDTIVLRTGSYNEEIRLLPTKSGTKDARITIKAYKNEKPLIEGKTVKVLHNEGLIHNQADYITFDGLKVTNSSGSLISNNGGDNVIIQNCELSYAYKLGINSNSSLNVLIQNNNIYETCRINYPHSSAKVWPTAIGTFDSRYIKILKNYVHDNHGEGIGSWKDSYNNEISSNIVKDNWSVGIYLDNAHYTKVDSNIIYNTKPYVQRWKNNEGWEDNVEWRSVTMGISMADEDYSSIQKTFVPGEKFVPASHNNIENNIIINVREGINFAWQYVASSGSGLKNDVIKDNMVLNTWEEAFRMSYTQGLSDHKGTVVENNFFHSLALKVQEDLHNERTWLLNARCVNDALFKGNVFSRDGNTSTDIQFAVSKDSDFENKEQYNFTDFNKLKNSKDNKWDNTKLIDKINEMMMGVNKKESPLDNVTVAKFATYVQKMLGLKIDLNAKNSPVKLKATNTLSKQDAMYLLEITLSKAKRLSTNKVDLTKVYVDYSEIAKYAKDSVAKLRSNKILYGENLNPKAKLTNAEMATMIYRSMIK